MTPVWLDSHSHHLEPLTASDIRYIEMKHNITPENSDNESSDTSMYDASTDIDSPSSTSSTFILNLSCHASDLNEIDPMINHENVASPLGPLISQVIPVT